MCHLLRLLSCLAFYVEIFIKALKSYTSCILKLSIITLHFLFFFNTAVDTFLPLSDDIELLPRPKQDTKPCFLVRQSCLNRVASHNFSKIQSSIAYNCIHKFDITCLYESYLNSETLSINSNLQTPGYNFAMMNHPSNTKRVCAFTTNVLYL